MESNRLLLLVDRSTMGGMYAKGIQDINANSYMVNELVVRIGKITGTANSDYVFTDGHFTQLQLQPNESLWVYFEKAGTSEPIMHSFMLAERDISQLTETEEIDGVTVGDGGAGKEYWMQLPQAILQNPGVWNFSFALKHIASVDNEGNYVFDYVKSSSAEHPYNLTVNASLVRNDGDELATHSDVVALWEQIKSLATGSGIFGYVKEFTKDDWTPIIGGNGAYLDINKATSKLNLPYVTAFVVNEAVKGGTTIVGKPTDTDCTYDLALGNDGNANYIRVHIGINLSQYSTYNGIIYLKERISNE